MADDSEAAAVLAALGYVPDIGECFKHRMRGDTEQQSFRVTGWMRRRRPSQPHPDPEVEGIIRAAMDRAGLKPRGAGPDDVPLEFCTRDQAEYVGGSGVCGVIVRVAECVSYRRVDMPEELIESARRHAAALAGEPLI